MLVLRRSLLLPHRFELDRLAGPLGAFQAADTVAVIGVVMNVDARGASLVAIVKKRADAGADLQFK